PYHHLYEFGDTSIFFVIAGLIKKAVVDQETGEIKIKTVVPMRITVDERISDGVYFNNAFELFNSFIQDPTKLETFPENQKNPYPHIVFKKKKKDKRKK
ncbi:MAG: hypothetical protein KAT14_06930, partial [Candidatus Marinimicrobia bacterium]|nr:hypothetical protein [Candidatus Neomarinimicrobiota bacterium]